MPVVDIHTHVYPPSFVDLLRSRTAVPYIRSFPPDASSRLIILPGEDSPSNPSTSRGRPIGDDYYDISKKIEFMDKHHIDISVISLANPWLDFLPPNDAGPIAQRVNEEVNELCNQYPGRLFAFGALPLSASIETIVEEIVRLSEMKYMKGVIMGTSGLGQGLDDPGLDAIYEALQEHRLTIFLHPHYGLPKDVFGPRASEYGHVLPLALGFPLETTIAVTRMLLSGVWDRFKTLNVLLAHSGGTLPFLAGRIESCVDHDSYLLNERKNDRYRSIWDVLKNNIYLDAVIYSHVGLKTAVDASGSDRIMFGMSQTKLGYGIIPALEDTVVGSNGHSLQGRITLSSHQ
jgi:aminocarboxymuconate-semialdehyde decarboxylase